MLPGAVAEWIDASSFRHDPMAQVSASTVREDLPVSLILVPAVRNSFRTVFLGLLLNISVRTHQVASVILY